MKEFDGKEMRQSVSLGKEITPAPVTHALFQGEGEAAVDAMDLDEPQTGTHSSALR